MMIDAPPKRGLECLYTPFGHNIAVLAVLDELRNDAYIDAYREAAGRHGFD
jgi:hypothetical protein